LASITIFCQKIGYLAFGQVLLVEMWISGATTASVAIALSSCSLSVGTTPDQWCPEHFNNKLVVLLIVVAPLILAPVELNQAIREIICQRMQRKCLS
jgi:hypothetical protein